MRDRDEQMAVHGPRAVLVDGEWAEGCCRASSTDTPDGATGGCVVHRRPTHLTVPPDPGQFEGFSDAELEAGCDEILALARGADVLRFEDRLRFVTAVRK